jgi:hypothetical protein
VASRTAASPTLALSRLREDPVRLFTDAGLTPDDWQAKLADGVLIDVTATAREAGIRYPVAMTRAAGEEVDTCWPTG